MTGDEPQDSIPEPPVIPPAEPPPEPYPFWSYVDLLLIAAMTVPCMALGILLVHGVLWLFHYRPVLVVAELLPAQILGYAFVFAAVAMMFRMQYGKPFWRSLAWLPLPLPSFWVVTAGVWTAGVLWRAFRGDGLVAAWVAFAAIPH